MRDQVFISYSHRDRRWLDLLQTFLKPYIRLQIVDVWADTRIKPGQVWHDEIKQALARANVAVLLVSPHFLASDFIDQEELPPLLEAEQNNGLIIKWIAVSASAYEVTPIGKYQAMNPPSKPLDTLSVPNRNRELVRICKEIAAQGAIPASPPPARPLTKRELEVLQLLDGDLSYFEIAFRLHLKTSTVKTYILNIFSKLEVHNRAAAIQRARERNLI